MGTGASFPGISVRYKESSSALYGTRGGSGPFRPSCLTSARDKDGSISREFGGVVMDANVAVAGRFGSLKYAVTINGEAIIDRYERVC